MRAAFSSWSGSRRAGGADAPSAGGLEQSRGYTAVEVLMAMTVMAIGAGAVISMQRASVQGNLDARATDMANTAARTWMERLQREAMQWTVPGRSNPTGASNLPAGVLSNGIANPGQWFNPTQLESMPNQSTAKFYPSFDILGRDVSPTDDAAFFCTAVAVTPLTNTNDLYRADVRVLWPRAMTGNSGSQTAAACAEAVKPLPDPVNFHAIYLTTSIKGNPQ